LESDSRNDFTKGKVANVILRMALPMIAAQLVNVLYNIVDRMYIGHIPVVGGTALTGLGLTMPIITLIAAFANLSSFGGVPLCSIARGRGDTGEAEQVMGNSFSLLIIFGVVLTAAFLITKKQILYLFGASDDTFPYANGYSMIYIIGTVFVMITLGMNGFINSQGFAKTGMMTVVLGAAVNIVLDPIFIFVFGMGVYGAALATVIAQACSAFWVLKFLTGKKAILDLKLKNMYLVPKTVGSIFSLGVTGFLMQVTTSVNQILCNVTLLKYGGDLYVGVMTVINSIREILTMPISGLTAASQPVMGFNFGAGAYNRVRECIRFISLINIGYGLFIWAVTMLVPGILIKIFNNEPPLVQAGIPAIRIYFCGILFMALQISGQSTFVALGKSRYAITFSLLRKIVIVLPLIIILPRLWGLGVNGVFLSEPISDLVGGTACYLTMIFTIWVKLGKQDKARLGSQSIQ
jgi:putative MATE family efflux protein